MDKKVEDAIKIFKTKILSNPNFNSTIFYEKIGKIKFLRIRTESFTDGKSNYKVNRTVPNNALFVDGIEYSAFYRYDKDEIVYRQESKDPTTIVHELIHAAVDKQESELDAGFARTKFTSYTSFNEGIVQWIACKAIYGNDINNNAYPTETRLMRLLSMAVGYDNLIKYYSNCDLRNFNRDFPLKKNRNAILTLARYMEQLHFIIEEQDSMEEKNNFDQVELAIYLKITDRDSEYYLREIQKIIIDLFIEYQLKVATLDEIAIFNNSLITINCDNPTILYIFEPILKRDYHAQKYFNNKIKKITRK
jgi:hypothetical protein